MDSTVENAENKEEFVTEQHHVTPEAFTEEKTAGDPENTGDNADENGTFADRDVVEEKANSEVNVDQESEKAATSIDNTDKEGLEVVEIEEKVIIETLDEAKSAEDSDLAQKSQERTETGNVDDGTTDLPLTQETESQSSTSEINPAETPEQPKQPEFVDILGNGLLKKKILKAGNEGSSRPSSGQEVCLKCEGTLPSGDKVDVNEKLKFVIGDGDVITALDLCVPTMLESEVCELVVAPRFAYGSFGRGNDDGEGDVPPDSEISYILELLSVEKGPDISNLTDEQRIALGDQKRERGNELFKREEYSLAVHSYSRALKYLGSSTSPAVVELKVKCWNNISASHLRVQEYTSAKKACDSVLKVDPNNVKALFRKGKVLIAENEFEEALELLKKANSLDPENRLIRRELQVARQKCGESREKERSMYQRMVGGLNNDDTASEDYNAFFTWPVILGITGIAIGGVVAALYFSRH